MSELDNIIQDKFTEEREPDDTAWGMDTVLDYDGGKDAIKDLILNLIEQSYEKDLPLHWLAEEIKKL